MSAISSPAADRLRSRIAGLLKVEEDRKLEVYQTLFQSAGIADLHYWLELFLAAGIATLGLAQNSVAVIIGGMLLSPVMGPILAAGLALALGDFYLGLKALLNVAASVAAVVLCAAGLVWLLPFHAVTAEILARTQPTLLELAIAILAGLAGAFISCRGGRGGGVQALPGVAIAVSFLPPLCVAGFGIGSGLNWPLVRGGGLLFLTNLAALVAASLLTFFAVRMDAPETRAGINDWLENQERRDRLYGALQHSFLRVLVGPVGTPPRRALILLVFLLAVLVPLRSGLVRVREEALVRGVVGAELRRIFADGTVALQQLDPGPPVRLRLVATSAVTPDLRDELESEIEAQTGRPVELTVQEAGNRAEFLALSRETAPAAASLADLENARPRFLETLDAALESAWPAAAAPLADYALSLHPDGLELTLTYLAAEPLSPAAEEAIQRGLEARLAVPLELVFEPLEPRRNLFRWTSGLTRPPAAAAPEMESLADVLTRHPNLECRLVFPEHAASGLAQAVTNDLETQGLSGSRCRVVMLASPDSWVFAQMAKK